MQSSSNDFLKDPSSAMNLHHVMSPKDVPDTLQHLLKHGSLHDRSGGSDFLSDPHFNTGGAPFEFALGTMDD